MIPWNFYCRHVSAECSSAKPNPVNLGEFHVDCVSREKPAKTMPAFADMNVMFTQIAVLAFKF